MKKKQKDELFYVNIVNEVEHEDGSATWTIEYDQAFLTLLKRHFKVDTIVAEDMEKYFLRIITESIDSYAKEHLTTEELDSIKTDI
jgi:mannosyltransferase OCH1-like enzyme